MTSLDSNRGKTSQDFPGLLRILGREEQAEHADSQADAGSPAELARGEAAYTALRQRLIRYFIWERSADPEMCADETLFRVARKVAEGEAILNVRAYVFGVARVVSREVATSARRQVAAMEEFAARQSAGENEDAEGGTAQCLGECLAGLSGEQRRFILRYYLGSRHERIENRKRMAEEEGVGLNALRNRALRIREQLEKCTRQCMERRWRP